MKLTILYAVGIAAVLGAYLYTSTSDYNAMVLYDRHYDMMVCGGHWPDYDNKQPSCGGEQ